MKILCRTTEEGPAVIPVDGLPCGVPGLAITRAMNAPGYSITHLRSGCCVLWFPGTDPEGILAAALELATLADWTRPGTDTAAWAEIGPQAQAIGRKYGAQFYARGIRAHGEDIQ